MKKIILFVFILLAVKSFSQDTSKVSAVKDTAKKQCRHSCAFSHEVGANMTLFMKQVFNLSSSTFTTLPYDLTYKLIHKDKWAIRAGAGITINNSSSESSTTVTTSGTNPAVIPGPDPVVPTINNSRNVFYRIGWECRHSFDKRIMGYAGLDFAGQVGSSNSQSSQVFNNLPTQYEYLKTTDEIKTMAYGGGPVFGFQVFIAKKLSLFTEMPLYFQYTTQTENTDSYQNLLDFSGNYVSEDSKQITTNKTMKLSVIAPVTLYLALKF
ncbi:MAG: hypothetical protein HY063_11725 [Bacteroidetes bacterium]|nr:hypothetical protein [Bacteroidota bacterium]